MPIRDHTPWRASGRTFVPGAPQTVAESRPRNWRFGAMPGRAASTARATMTAWAVLASPLPALGAEAPPVVDGLHTQKSFLLTEARNGISGRIELLEDARLPELRRKKMFPASVAGDPCMRPRKPTVAQLCESLDETGLRMGELRLVDEMGTEVASREFLWGATLEVVHLYGDARVSYVVKVDESAGFGSYSGWMSYFAEVSNGFLRWITAADVQTGQDKEMILMSSLKTEWHKVPRRSGPGQDFLVLACRPDWDHLEGGFVMRFQRYSFAEGRWRFYERVQPGFWEMEEPFPERREFP